MESKRCKAHRRDGQQCSKWALAGAEVCLMHGGKTPQVRAAAARRVLEDEARQLLASEGVQIEPVTNPLEALAQLAGECLAMKEHFSRLAGRLGDDGLRYEHHRAGEQLRAEVAAYERAADRCERILSRMSALDVDGRLAAIGERQAAVIGQVFQDAIARLPLTPDVVADATAFVMAEVQRRSTQLDGVLVGNVVRSGYALPA